jgi:transposase
MRDKELYRRILGIQTPWEVSGIELDLKAGEVKVYVEQKPGVKRRCPQCGVSCPGYDKRRRQWRHLDTCQLKTLLVAELPRVQCVEHGVVSVRVPWAEPGSGFTALYEALVIDWLKEASTQAVSRQLSLSWNAIDGIMQRAVKRGLARRQVDSPKHIGVDEIAFRKRHDYLPVVADGKKVLYVADERKKASLKGYYATLSEAQKAGIESVSMDMWPAYINATLEEIPGGERKIAFEKFHVAKYLGEAVDKVRRQEHKALMSEGWEDVNTPPAKAGGFGLRLEAGSVGHPAD